MQVRTKRRRPAATRGSGPGRLGRRQFLQAAGLGLGAGALAGGSLGGMFGATMEVAVRDERLEAFAARLNKDTSALVLVSDPERADAFVNAFKPYNGVVVETHLNEHDVKALSEALKAERKRSS